MKLPITSTLPVKNDYVATLLLLPLVSVLYLKSAKV